MKKVFYSNLSPDAIKNIIYSSIKVEQQSESLPTWSSFGDIVGFESNNSLIITKGRYDNAFEGRVLLNIEQTNSGSAILLQCLPMRNGAKVLSIMVSIVLGLFGLLLRASLVLMFILLFWAGGIILKKKLEQDIVNNISKLISNHQRN
jgi:hypothetical protein